MWWTLDRTYGESLHKAINYYDSPSYYITWILNHEWILSMRQNQQEALTYEWDPKVVIYPYGLGHFLWTLVATGILNRDTMISHGIKSVSPLRWSKEHVIMKSVATIIPLLEFDKCSLELEYVIDHIISRICNLRIWEVILIGDNTTLLNYGHQFMGSLHVITTQKVLFCSL